MELAELAVFVRAPVTGSVKTRLHSAIGPARATELYQAFVEDVVARCTRVQESGRVTVALWADDATDVDVQRWAETLGVSALQQPDDDLGARLTTAFERGLAHAERVIVIGSDSPTLPLASIALAYERLDDAPLVLGPSNDGGYVLIGACGAIPAFEGVRWSTEHAYRDTCAANASLAVATLPPWYDIDDEVDLDTLRAHLSVDPAAAPVTASMLTRLARQR